MENNYHIKVTTYCCFLPDLTRFTASYCAGPKPCKRSHQKAIHTVSLYSFFRKPSRVISRMAAHPCVYLIFQQIQIPASHFPLQLKDSYRRCPRMMCWLLSRFITARSTDNILPLRFIQFQHCQEFIQRRVR